MARLLYESGLRSIECLRLRVKDVDFFVGHIIVRDRKGFKDRVTVLPHAVVPELKDHLVRVRTLHQDFLRRGYGEVELPYPLARIRTRGWSGTSNTYFVPPMCRLIPAQTPSADITRTKALSNER